MDNINTKMQDDLNASYEQLIKDTVAKLIVKRREAHGNPEEQQRISVKLQKLYDIQWTMGLQYAEKHCK